MQNRKKKRQIYKVHNVILVQCAKFVQNLICNNSEMGASYIYLPISQFSSVTQSCLTLCDPMDCSTPGFPVHHQLPELAQTHVHQVGGM